LTKTTLFLVLIVLPAVFLAGLDRSTAYGDDGAAYDLMALQSSRSDAVNGQIPVGVTVGATSHQGRFTDYAGSATCLPCHQTEVNEVFDSVHYQWAGATPRVPGLERGGKLGGINDFCIYPDINFIGQMTNLDGQVIDGGCGACHVGLGRKPEATATPEQLANIDCLICHSVDYKRKVVNVGGAFLFQPAPEKMTRPIETVITDITLPGNAACVNCHAYAGGGNNNKRGDIEEAHRQVPSKSFDVHMASQKLGGAGLSCTDCHLVQEHKFPGRGTDLKPTDLEPNFSCADCHGGTPHQNYDLDKHTDRVSCTVCHIPYFAKGNSTDMIRDYSLPPEILESKRIYEPHIQRQANVEPVYRFSNGDSRFYEFGTPVTLGPNGRVVMAGPLGNIEDPNAKIIALKKHLGNQPYDLFTNYLLPPKMGILFQQGDVNAAVLAGAAAMGWPLQRGYGFMKTERYMGLYHEVAPKEEALTCTDCHSGGQRLDFPALGYAVKTTLNNKPLCASCHGDKSGAWSASQMFTRVHGRHVEDRNIDCTQCHIFQAPDEAYTPIKKQSINAIINMLLS
jgi:hypothetical protein